MGKLKQLMIEEMDMATEHGDLMGDGIKVDLNQGHPQRHQPAAILATLERKR